MLNNLSWKDIIPTAVLVVAMTAFAIRLEGLANTNKQTVETLRIVVEQMDNRVTDLEKDRIWREAYEAGLEAGENEAHGN